MQQAARHHCPGCALLAALLLQQLHISLIILPHLQVYDAVIILGFCIGSFPRSRSSRRGAANWCPALLLLLLGANCWQGLR
jgi:hypothetical protein